MLLLENFRHAIEISRSGTEIIWVSYFHKFTFLISGDFSASPYTKKLVAKSKVINILQEDKNNKCTRLDYR